MSTLTSILGTDLISNAPSVLNSNFDALNVDKAEKASPAFTGVPTAPTASVGTATTQIATTEFVTNATAGAMTTFITYPATNGTPAVSSDSLTSSIVSRLGMFILPVGMTVHAVSLQVVSVLTQGSFRVGIFNSSGQSSVLSTVFPSIASNGIKTTNLSSVLLNAGNYYHAVTPIDGTATFRTMNTGNVTELGSTSVIGKAGYTGNASVSGGALPTTFNPTTLEPIANNQTISIRLDN